MPTHIDYVTEQLAKPLDRKHVKERTQAGRSLSYVEGWHAIAEANRIFGFDGWTRETLEMKEVRPAELVKLTKQGRGGSTYEVEQWRVGFCAKVRVIAHGIAREGYGFGSGFASDLGDAYESAIKEAETDAMKRALMTFGNPFGLALYDKTQANVADGVEDYEAPGEPDPFPIDPDVDRKSAHYIKKNRPNEWPEIVEKFRSAKSPDELKQVAGGKYVQEMTKDWPVGFLDELRGEFKSCMDAFKVKAAAE